MDINERQLKELIQKGEGISLEFKTCRSRLSRDVYETVCAFLNRYGGTILLGVQNDGTIQGMEPSATDQIRKDFVTAINNPQKLNPPAYIFIEEVTVEDKCLLRVYVPDCVPMRVPLRGIKTAKPRCLARFLYGFRLAWRVPWWIVRPPTRGHSML